MNYTDKSKNSEISQIWGLDHLAHSPKKKPGLSAEISWLHELSAISICDGLYALEISYLSFTIYSKSCIPFFILWNVSCLVSIVLMPVLKIIGYLQCWVTIMNVCTTLVMIVQLNPQRRQQDIWPIKCFAPLFQCLWLGQVCHFPQLCDPLSSSLSQNTPQHGQNARVIFGGGLNGDMLLPCH